MNKNENRFTPFMFQLSGGFFRVACIVTIIAICATPSGALEIIREVEPDAKNNAQHQQHFQPDVLEQWLFNGQAKFSTARKNLEKKLTAKLKLVGRVCELTETQRSKLQLAGSGDIHRFMRECEKMRREFDPADQGQVQNLWQNLQPLRNKFNSTLFDDRSMFECVQKQTLRKEQFQTLEKREREAREFALETAIRQLIAGFDNCSPLKTEDRKALTRLLSEKVPLPLAMKTSHQRQMARHYVLYSCSKIPQADLKAFFDDESWKVFDQGMQNCRGYKNHFQSIGMIK